jgi:hypothetical protein
MTAAEEAKEYDRRREIERIKAFEKYGELAALPGGHPDKDILDYVINEAVGLFRYGEMLRHRIQVAHQSGTIDKLTFGDGLLAASHLMEQSYFLSVELIGLYAQLEEAGANSGSPENPR